MKLFALRVGLNPDHVMMDMDMAEVLQLIHADGVRNGGRYVWKNFFEVSQEIMDEFETLANKPLPDL